MGTSTDNCGRQETEPVIPWSCVDFITINKLVQLLTPYSVRGNDWRGLAARLGYSSRNISSIEGGKNNNTDELFNDYAQKPKASFNEVYRCLQDMNRQDCLEVLTNHFEEIKSAYHQQKQQKSSLYHLSGGEMLSPSSGHFLSYPHASFGCGFVSQPVAGSVCSPHHCCSMAHGFRSCPHNPHSMPAHQHPVPTCSPVLHYDWSSAPKYHPQHQHQMNVQMDRSSLPSQNGNRNPPDQMNSYMDRNIHSMSLHQPISMRAQNPGTSYSTERPGPNGYLSSGAAVPYHSEDMAIKSSNSPSSPQSVSQDYAPFKSYNGNIDLPHNINPQDNSNLVSIGSSCTSNNGSWRPLIASLSQSQVSIVANDDVANNRDAMARPAAAAAEYSDTNFVDSKGSLQKLFQISKVPEQYQPTAEYTRVVAEQRIEDEKKSNKAGKDSDKKESVSRTIGSLSSATSASSGSKSENSNTYPLRVKANDMTKDFAAISIKKSTSLPNSYKPQEHQKVHNTKLFLTYSPDSEEHKNEIYSFCIFLKENNFRFYVDAKDIPQDANSDVEAEYVARLKTADHVLVCVSSKYLEDISQREPTPPSEKQLHTHQIYQHLCQEYTDNMKNGKLLKSRAVIILFDSFTSDRLPEWMRKCPTYKWPSDFENLYWMLTKPHNKIKAKCTGASPDISGRQY